MIGSISCVFQLILWFRSKFIFAENVCFCCQSKPISLDSILMLCPSVSISVPCAFQPVLAEEVLVYYKIILFSFYLEGTASIVMLLLGQQYYYFLALYPHCYHVSKCQCQSPNYHRSCHFLLSSEASLISNVFSIHF